MDFKEIAFVDELIEKKKKELISYCSDKDGKIPRIEKVAEWDKVKEELNILDKINSVLFAHGYMVENNKLDFGYVVNKLISGTALIYYEMDDVGRNVVNFFIRDKIDSDDTIAEFSLHFVDKQCYLMVDKAPERNIEKSIRNVNLNVELPTCTDTECLHKLCGELSQTLNNRQMERNKKLKQ